nr:EOG090X0P2R [Eurycercus lamellatus]
MASEESPKIVTDSQETAVNEESESKTSQKEIEKMEEEKLKARYNNARPVTGHSAFLQKRLAKNQKYFDSGDYQMAKQKGPAKIPTAATNTATAATCHLGERIGTRYIRKSTAKVSWNKIITNKMQFNIKSDCFFVIHEYT